MKKSPKNFLISIGVSILFFIASLIIQYYFTVVTSIKIMIAIAIWCGLLEAIALVIMSFLEQGKIIKVFLTFTTISMVFLLSTLGNQLLNNISIICFGIGMFLTMIALLYSSIKKLLKAYKEYKEKS